jgi:PIN domain nuclease of toxin-antitoxin system
MPTAMLLDSNMVIWLDQRPSRLRDVILYQIQNCPQVYLSAVTAWELGIKQSLGKLTLVRPVSEFIRENNLTELPVTVEHGEAVSSLPLHHHDPFDRLLVAQAKVEGAVLVTSDKLLLRYGIPILLV